MNVSFPHEAIQGLDFFSAQVDVFPNITSGRRCGEHFPSSPFSQATIALRKKKAIVVKRFSISRQLARATTVSIHMHATIYTKIS